MSDIIIISSNNEVSVEFQARALEVKEKLLSIKNSVEDHFFDTCELLLEARDKEYHTVWGYARFSDWVEQSPELGISARQAAYYINIASKSKILGLTRDQLKAAKISNLKEIFVLEPEENGDDMKQLVLDAPQLTLDEVKNRVRKLKDSAAVDMSYMTIKIPQADKETFDKAIKLARLNHGGSEVNGEQIETSVGHCLNLICLSYLQDPNNYPEGITEGDL